MKPRKQFTYCNEVLKLDFIVYSPQLTLRSNQRLDASRKSDFFKNKQNYCIRSYTPLIGIVAAKAQAS